MAQLYQTPVNNNLQYTLNTQMGAGDTSLTLNTNVNNIVNAPGVLVVDRVDSAGNKTASVREYISFTGVSGTSITGLSRGLAGSTGQAHNVGAIVEFVPDVVQETAWYNVFTTEHTVGGNHGTLPSTALINTQKLYASQATLGFSTITSMWSASGASLQSYPQVPVWVFPGTLSGVSTNLGRPLDMLNPGNIQYITAITRIGSSNASLFLNLTKNGSNILNGTTTTSLLYIPLNGTFVSIAASLSSMASTGFNAGDVFNFSVVGQNSMAGDLTIKFFAR